MDKLDSFSGTQHSKISSEILCKNYRSRLGLYAQKIIYSLVPLVDSQDELPEWEISAEQLFRFLNLNKRNKRRYEILSRTISEIIQTPLESRKDSLVWEPCAWFSKIEVNHDNGYKVTLKFNEQIRSYLVGLKTKSSLQSQYFFKLSSSYSLWLYIRFKSLSSTFPSILVFTFEEIRILTFNETTDSYDPDKNKDSNRNILRNILGLERRRGEEYLSPVIRKNIRNEWKEVGAIAEINQKTDLNIYCEVIKKGRKFTGVLFKIQLKQISSQTKRLDNPSSFSLHAPNPIRHKNIKINTISPSSSTEISIPIETVKELASFQSISVTELLKELGYRRVGDRVIKL